MTRDLSKMIITTYSGVEIDLLNLKPSDIKIEDIEHALSMQCRFNGHCLEFYSVAQHSVLVSDYLRDVKDAAEELQLLGLMHDAAEAYIGDIISPIKHFPKMAKHIKAVEESVNDAINARFALDWSSAQRNLVKYADKVLLVTEARDLLRAKSDHWYPKVPRLNSEIRAISHRRAKVEFIHRFDKLTTQRQCAMPNCESATEIAGNYCSDCQVESHVW